MLERKWKEAEKRSSNSKNSNTCYFLLNYAMPTDTASMAISGYISCYFLLNYALDDGEKVVVGSKEILTCYFLLNYAC